MIWRVIATVMVACVSATCPVVGAEDTAGRPYWPEFHGPRRDNISSETGLLKRWPEGGPRLIWKYSDCGTGFSGVSIAEGKIFTAGDFGDRELLIALDLDGKLLWTSPNGNSWQGPSLGSRTTPTYEDGVLYHLNPTGRLAAYRAESGKQIWSVDLKSRFGARYGGWAMAENLVIDGDKVLCIPGGSKALAAALNKRTGETIWTTTGLTDRAAYCSPVVATYQGVRQLITMTDKSVVAIDVRTGKLLWTYPYKMRFSQHATTPVFHDGHVFVACGHSTGGTMLRINPDLRGVTKVWYMRQFDNCHGGVVHIGGRLYGCGCRLGGKGFFCVDFLSGKTIGTDHTVGKVSIAYADGRLYCLNHKGRMYLMEITPDGVKVVSHFDMPGPRKTNVYLAHPVICGGRLYLRHANHLYAHHVRAE